MKFHLVVFGSQTVQPASWDGILELLKGEHSKCYEKVLPHVEVMKTMSLEALKDLAKSVESWNPEVVADVDSFDKYANSQIDTLQHARSFLRHTLKCTLLFRGDGYAYDDNDVRGTEEYLVPRVQIKNLPVPSTGVPSPIFCLSDDIEEQVAKYRLWKQEKEQGN